MPSSTIGHEDTLSPDEAAPIQEFVGFLRTPAPGVIPPER